DHRPLPSRLMLTTTKLCAATVLRTLELLVAAYHERDAMHSSSIISRSSRVAVCALAIITARCLTAQQPASAAGTRPVLHSAAYQIAAAVTPLPEEMRAGAAVLGYTAIGKPLVTLREGKNDMICLAPDPAATAFHAACYHKAMEPFMARGRSLRATGVTGGQVDTVRFA